MFEFFEDKFNEYIDSHFPYASKHRKNKNYIKLKKDYDNLLNDISNKLGENNLQIFDSFIETICEMSAHDQRLAYKVGLIEGIAIKNDVESIIE